MLQIARDFFRRAALPLATLVVRPWLAAASLVVSVFCILIAWLNFRFIRPRNR